MDLKKTIGKIFGGYKEPPKVFKEDKKKVVSKEVPIVVPNGRVSSATKDGRVIGNQLGVLNNEYNMVSQDDIMKAIPYIRRLFRTNPDLGSTVFDITQLTNTGHIIKFDQSVSQEEVTKMRAHLDSVSEEWHQGAAGIDGLINKWVAQIYITGALSNEWVPKLDLSGIDYNALVDTETIEFGRKEKGKYEAFQRTYEYGRDNSNMSGLRKLNPNTYKYYGLISDTDTPYGIPPYLTALCSIADQTDMNENIRHIINQVGLVGFMEVLLDKPNQNPNESLPDYEARLKNLLTETINNLKVGMKEGVTAGFQEDHTFNFQTATKNVTGVKDIYNLNQVQLANGLKTSPIFLGVGGGSSETFISIVFSKMLSQLKNTQQIIAKNLQKGYELELKMAGFKFKSIKVEFKPSTITDDVKIQQGRESKQRTLRALWIDGIISQEVYAEEMGYIKPSKKRDPLKLHVKTDTSKPTDQTEDEAKRKKREADKDKSDRKSRDKNKPVPKRKDQDTKER